MSKLFYVIGASGAGKDTLLNYARATLNGTELVIFAHRYITRPYGMGNEDHVSLTHQEFRLRAGADLFALSWESHGNYYGIGTEIDTWMANGFNVIVNGSRQYLPQAKELYPNLVVILIEASADVIARRLANRGRETQLEIIRRIERTAEITADLSDCIRISNNDTVEEAGDKLVNMIRSTQKLFI